MVEFVNETDVPPAHEALVRRFAAKTGGRLEPTAVAQVELADRPALESLQHGDPTWSLQLVAGGRLYRVPLRHYGGSYDVEAVLAAVHRVPTPAATSGS